LDEIDVARFIFPCYLLSMRCENTKSNSSFDFKLTCGATLLALSGCVAQVIDDGLRPNEELPEDIEPFDASVPDGGQAPPAETCADDAVHRINNDFSPYRGGEEAVDVAVAHFSSLYCIHCANFAAQTRNLWDSRPDFRARARIYFHHADYTFRHRAAVAAWNQGMDQFWALHDFIYSKMLASDSPSEKEVLYFVQTSLHLDMDRFRRDLESDETYSFLLWELEQAIAVGVEGTPTVYICGQNLPNRYYLEDAVDGYLSE
jgi:protein-disulfide isomerase